MAFYNVQMGLLGLSWEVELTLNFMKLQYIFRPLYEYHYIQYPMHISFDGLCSYVWKYPKAPQPHPG